MRIEDAAPPITSAISSIEEEAAVDGAKQGVPQPPPTADSFDGAEATIEELIEIQKELAQLTTWEQDHQEHSPHPQSSDPVPAPLEGNQDSCDFFSVRKERWSRQEGKQEDFQDEIDLQRPSLRLVEPELPLGGGGITHTRRRRAPSVWPAFIRGAGAIFDFGGFLVPSKGRPANQTETRADMMAAWQELDEMLDQIFPTL